MNEFLQRLKQRKLVQWALAYIGAAFALLQGIDIVAQQFGWPDGVRRGITLALVVGFFVALVLAWYHGERGAQRVTGTELVILDDLALINMGSGDKAAALTLAERAMVVNPIGKDAVTELQPVEILARVTARMGEPERAIAALEKLLSTPYEGPLAAGLPLTPALLRLDPMFDPLRNDPRFQKFCQETKP
jgi:hypothetical protein